MPFIDIVSHEFICAYICIFHSYKHLIYISSFCVCVYSEHKMPHSAMNNIHLLFKGIFIKKFHTSEVGDLHSCLIELEWKNESLGQRTVSKAIEVY